MCGEALRSLKIIIDANGIVFQTLFQHINQYNYLVITRNRHLPRDTGSHTGYLLLLDYKTIKLYIVGVFRQFHIMSFHIGLSFFMDFFANMPSFNEF